MLQRSARASRTVQFIEHLVDVNEMNEQLVWDVKTRLVVMPRGEQRALICSVLERVLATRTEELLVKDFVELVLQVHSERQSVPALLEADSHTSNTRGRAVQCSAGCTVQYRVQVIVL